MSLVAVTAIGPDRPGIVTGVTKVLFEHGCNLQDVSSTILGGHFSMMLVVSVPEDSSAEELESSLLGEAEELGLTISVRSVREPEGGVMPPTDMVSVYGADRPGIVFKVAETIGEVGGNITDLTSRVIGSEAEPVYALMLEVAVGEGVDLAARLEGLKEELGVEISTHPIGADVL